jgi:hypothetical protein
MVLVGAAGILAIAAFGGFGFAANAASAMYETIAQTTHQGTDSHGNPASGHNYGSFGGWGNNGDCFTTDNGDCGFHHNPGDSQYGGHYPICERTGNPANPWVLMYISPDDIDAYAANDALIPAPPNGCPNQGDSHAHSGTPYDSVVLSPTHPTSTTVEVATTTLTVNGAVGPISQHYVWRIDGDPVQTTDTTSLTDTLNLTGHSLGAHDSITVEVTPSAGPSHVGPTAVDGVSVTDTPPVIASVTITPAGPTTNQVLTANVVQSDADSDTLTDTYQWFKNGNAISGQTGPTLDLSVPGNGDHSDVITVTVVANDGIASSAPATSPPDTVVNTPPTATVSLSPTSPNVNNTVTATPTTADVDGDAVTVTYAWTVGGTPVVGAHSSTLNLSTVPGAHKGQAVVVTATPNDGNANGTPATASITIVNAPPVIDSVTITPATPHTNDVLTAAVTSHDPDGDTVTYSYQWTKNGNPISGATGPTLNLATVGNGDKGDVIGLNVTPNDGTVNGAVANAATGVTVVDSAPVVDSVTIGPAGPHTNDLLTSAVTSHDADGDTVTYAYQWYKNGNSITGATSTTLNLATVGNGDKNDVITLKVTPSDGTLSGAVATSNSLTVLNTPPTATVTLAPASPTVTGTVTATPTTADIDGDTVSVTYSWTVGGTPVPGATSSTLNLSTVAGAHKGQAVVVTATPNDGTAAGTPATASVTIANTPPVVDSVVLSAAHPHTNDILSSTVTGHDVDGDTITYSYQWTKNGVTIPGAIGPTLNLATPGNGDRGDVIGLTVTPNDGTANGLPVSSATSTVDNTPPTATVTLSSPLNIGGVATATATDADIDTGDTVSLVYVWKVNGTTVRTSPSTTALTDTYTLTGVHSGDTVTVTVTPNDGHAPGTAVTATGTVVDRAPSATVTLSPATPNVTNTVTATPVTSDPDGDPVTVSYSWTVGGSAVAGATSSTLNLATVPGAHKGQTVVVTATPNDGTLNGTPATASVTIADAPPVIDSVSVTPTTPHTNDVLTATVTSHDPDGDTVTYTYQWTKNGNPITGATSSTLNLATVGNGDVGDLISVRVTPSDGTLTGATANAATGVTVADTAPVVDSVTIGPAGPHTNDLLTSVVTSHDADGTPVTYTYQWFKNGNPILSQSGPTLDLSQIGNGDKGDVITLKVTPSDGTLSGTVATSNSLTVLNTPPTATVTLAPGSPNVSNTVTATPVTGDIDGDPVTVTYSWTVGGTTVPGATSSTLNLSTVAGAHKGQVVTVTAIPNDGTVNGTAATASVTIVNSPPVIDSVTITPTSPRTNDVLTANVTSHDPDGDTVTYTYQWTKNGSPISGATGPTLNLATAGNGNKGDAIGVTVTPNDGTVNGAVANAATTVTVADTAPTATVGLSSPLTAGGLATATATDADVDGDTVNLVYVWKVNGVTVRTSPSTTALTDTYTLTGAHHGDTVTVTVTPNDGTLTGTAAVATGTVLNTPPTATVSLSPATPNVTNTVTATPVTADADGDAVTVSYSWTVGGLPVSGATSSTLNLSTVAGAHKGQVVTVTATPNDGVVNGTAATASVTIGNAPPVVDSVTITPTSPHTNDLLTATVTGHDPDGDPVTYSYQWTRNGTAISGATGSTLNLATAGNGDKGDVIGVNVTPNDGTVNGAVANAASTITVLDTAPTATVSITGTPSTGNTLTAHATDADVDGDAVTLIYVWKVNGTTVRTSSSTSSLTDTYTLGTVHSGDTITVTVTPNDGTLSGTAVTATTTGADHPPTATVTLSPSAPVVGSTVTATPTTSDPDGDAVTVSYSWTVGGNVVTGATSSTLNLATVSGAHKGQVVTVTATPNDGTLNGTPATASVTIANSPPVIDSVTLSPNPAYRNSTISAIVVSHDPDGDPVTYSYQWFRNGVAISGQYGYQLELVCGYSYGDVITVKVTPNDGTVNGAAVTSAGDTISNAPPAATVALSGSATTGSTLTATATTSDADGNTVHLIYVWKVNGTTVRTSSSTTSLTDTYTLTGVHKGATVTVTVTPNDGTQNGTPVTATTTVADTAPTATVSLSPSSPLATGTVTATATSADADGDTVTLAYSWSVGGTTVSGATGSTLNLATVAGAHKGQVVKVTVTPNDGTLNGTAATASVTIANSPPVIDSVTLSPNPAGTNDTISAIVVSHDPDGDAVTYSYQWFNNGVAITGQYGYQLSLLNCGLDKGDVITVKVTASDGTATSAAVTSAPDTIADSAPVASVTLSGSPAVNGTLTANVTRSDADGDTVKLTYVWTVNGVVKRTTTLTTATSDSYTLTGASAGQSVVVTVTPNDGTLNGNVATASTTVTNPSETLAYTGGTTAVYSESMTLSNTLTPAVSGANVTYSWPSGGGGSAGSVGGPANGSVGYAPNWIGPKLVTTTYAGDSNHAAASTTATVTVSARSVISVSGSPNSSKSGQSVAIHAHLTENGSTFPSGTSVVFQDGSTTIGTVAINGSGDAILNISTLSVGTHTITASYAGTGSPAYILPVSASYTQTVTH